MLSSSCRYLPGTNLENPVSALISFSAFFSRVAVGGAGGGEGRKPSMVMTTNSLVMTDGRSPDEK